ncbi:hypothetical protein OYC61_012825 [Alcaligenes nematophilus]|uniref:Uncharacterized protein n=1 Tax=Alcaligenes nematophilus TaxID=2994643 RepID=A0ABU3MW25_9BURK|nr:hypothetical protein [Alcaligenes nematophilus]MDT8505183.1 hypothetical protein [Alcaligenes nematophilus]
MSIHDEKEELVQFALDLLPLETHTYTVDTPYRKEMDWLAGEVRKALEAQGRKDVAVTIASETTIRLDA